MSVCKDPVVHLPLVYPKIGEVHYDQIFRIVRFLVVNDVTVNEALLILLKVSGSVDCSGNDALGCSNRLFLIVWWGSPTASFAWHCYVVAALKSPISVWGLSNALIRRLMLQFNSVRLNSSLLRFTSLRI